MSMISVFDKVRGRGDKFVVAFVLAVAAGVYASIALLEYTMIDGTRYYVLSQDDPLISMRYARNFAEGHGLRWNAGEAPVEGYTNLLWTLLMALCHVLPIHESKISLCVAGFSGLCLLMNSLICIQLAKKLQLGPVALVSTAILTAFFWPLVWWSTGGFEVGMIACLISAGILVTIGEFRHGMREVLSLAAILTALVLSRPDCMLPVSVFIGALATRAWQGKLSWRCVLVVVSTALFAGLSVTAWRWYYYGEFLPNTYYLKATGVPLWNRLPKGLYSLWETLWTVLCGFLLFAILGSMVLVRAGHRTMVVLAWVVFGVSALYTVYLGGDTWERPRMANRFLTQAISPLIVIVAAFIDSIRRPRFFGWSALLMTVLVSTGSSTAILNRVDSVATMDRETARKGQFLLLRQGLWLRSHARSGDALGVLAAGTIPYFSRLPSYDLLGKSDPLIARLKPQGLRWGHNKWSNQYTLKVLRPRFLQQLWRPTVEEKREADSLGYRPNQVGLLEVDIDPTVQ